MVERRLCHYLAFAVIDAVGNRGDVFGEHILVTVSKVFKPYHGVVACTYIDFGDASLAQERQVHCDKDSG